MTAAKHGSAAELMPVITGPAAPKFDGIRFCERLELDGSNAANRQGLAACDDDAIIVLAADDVVFTRNWLATCLPAFLKHEQELGERPCVMGLRHIGGVGTAYGRMYANFPMFRKSMFSRFPQIAENFCPKWLLGQWGDVAFGMAVWRDGGQVRDSGDDILVRWIDRMGFPESPMKYLPVDDDIESFRRHFADMGQGWPRNFRGFNIDCPPTILENATICEPDPEKFRDRYRAVVPV